MNCKITAPLTLKFESLEEGEPFVCGEGIFLKIKEFSNEFEIKNAVNLRGGFLVYFCEGEDIIPCTLNGSFIPKFGEE